MQNFVTFIGNRGRRAKMVQNSAGAYCLALLSDAACIILLYYILRVVDVDECGLGLASCDYNARCINLPATYECACETGFTGDGYQCDGIQHLSVTGIRSLMANLFVT